MKKLIWFSVGVLTLVCAVVAGCAKSGAGGGTTTDTGGHPGMDLVAGGTVMTSANYKLVLTTGQGPGGNGVMTSASYTLQGGVVGSTQ
jgi:hypothetical protein